MTGMNLSEWRDTPTQREIRERIDQLDISADAKVQLMRIGEATIEISGRMVAVGRRIVAFAFDLLRQFPNLSFCLVVAMVISSLLTSIPLLGTLLGMFVKPLVMAAGVAGGAALEIKDGDLRGRVEFLVAEFQQILG